VAGNSAVVTAVQFCTLRTSRTCCTPALVRVEVKWTIGTLASRNSDLERIRLLLRNSPTTTLFLSHPGEDQPYRSSSVVPPLSHPHQHLKLSSFQASQRNTVDSTILGLVISLRSLPHPLVRTNESHCRQSGEQSWLLFAFLGLWTTRKISESRTRQLDYNTLTMNTERSASYT
jgi:hypothetical protein